MTLSALTAPAQHGLHKWAKATHGDEHMLDTADAAAWAWVWFQLRAATDNPEWFPHGKWATL